MLTQQLNDDLKAAMLAGDSARVETLRGLRSVILNAEIAAGKRDTGLPDDEIVGLFSKEAKKRQESADMYIQGGAQERAEKERAEKVIIEAYLPAQLDEAELISIVDAAIADLGAENMQAMGKVIGAVKAKVGASADGAIVARIVKERLSA